MGNNSVRSLNNNDLVDNLVASGYIKSAKVEQVYRLVDRAEYILSTHRKDAYKDSAWKHGNLHLSAPCIYGTVLENLSIGPGMSFLNIGSGTGYMSTMCGLFLKQNGINHGIELHEDCVKYAYDRLEEFKQQSLALDIFDFCEPLFIQGNCLNVMHGRRYDRVYCGAACPESHYAFIKEFVNVGGILIMPYKDTLLRIERTAENLWTHQDMLPVTFSTLVVPTQTKVNLVSLPDCEPLSLQEICRGHVRRHFQEAVWREHKDVKKEKSVKLMRKPPISSYIIAGEPSDDPNNTESSFQLELIRAQIGSDSESSDDDEASDDVEVNSDNLSSDSDEEMNEDSSNNRPRRNNRIVNRDVSREDYTRFAINLIKTTRVLTNAANRATETRDRSTVVASTSSSEPANNANSSTANKAADTSSNLQESPQKQDVSGGSPPANDKSPKSAAQRLPTVQPDSSDSESETDETAVIEQRKKIMKREKTDSGIVEDAMSLTNDEVSLSSYSSMSDPDGSPRNLATSQDMEVDLNIFRNAMTSINQTLNVSCSESNNEESIVANHIDSEAFSSYIKEKISQLPLPQSLKLYLNYNRSI